MATRTECVDDVGELLLSRLTSPTRNRYFYGKLLDTHHLELEQRYGNVKRWLLNRLSLGRGVLCGLEVAVVDDGAALRLGPGVAIDGLGREIIVPGTSRPIDPRQPTDACGRPDGPPIRVPGPVTVLLCYHECETEPNPVLVTRCEGERDCENGLIRERYRVQVRPGLPQEAPLVTEEQCATIFGPLTSDLSRRELVCRVLDPPCGGPEEICVPIATVTLLDDGRIAAVDTCRFRPNVYSNAILLDLILCLAARVDRCCGELELVSLRIVAGNDQTAPAGSQLPAPLVVRVVEANAPVANETVTFEVVAGDGEIGEDPNALGTVFQTDTAGDGTATLPIWRLGGNVGVQRVRASIAQGAPAQVLFRATATRVAVDLPVIRTIWPSNALRLDRDIPDGLIRRWLVSWLETPRIEVNFDREMNVAQIRNPDRWLRVFRLRSLGPNEIQVAPLPIRYAGRAEAPMIARDGVTELYAFGSFAREGVDDALGLRLLVLIRAEAGSIEDQADQLLLDAEFGGSRLTPEQMDEIWSLATPRMVGQEVWDALADTGGVLPESGDGTEGGRFDSWFAVRSTGAPGGNVG